MESRVLLLAPRGRDAAVIAELLAKVGVSATTCPDLVSLGAAVEESAAAAVVAEEALWGESLDGLGRWLADQPPWSDFPFIVLGAAGVKARSAHAADRLDGLGNVILLERPLHTEGLLRAVKSAIAARARQYEARSRIEAMASARVELEHEVVARTADLKAALEALQQQVSDRERVEEALRQSQKLEAVGQLTGGVAHDFNNLLTIIRSSVDFLRRSELPEARRRRYVEAISDTVDRASKLTGQLLAFARRQPLKPEVFDAARQVESVVDLVRPLVGGRIRIEAEIGPEPCFVEADVSQFETALVNLAVNARDAMDGEGRLTFRLSLVEHVPAVRGHVEASGAFVAVAISDTGTGIDPVQVASIFEPFFTTKEVGKGTGLGLSQVFGFAKQSGGEVDVESALGQGSTFTLYLPRAPSPAAPGPAAAPAEAEGGAVQNVCVLVVEDNEAVGRFATEMLEDLGYRTRWVGNADAALSVLAREELSFDAVFSDVIMPGMNGVELAQTIRRKHPGLPVVLTSGYSNVLAQEGRHGFELLQKPYSVDALARVLRKVVRKTAA